MSKWKALLRSRRFWVSAVGLIAVIASDTFGLELNTEQMVGIITVVVAWVIGDSVRPTV
jgi:uncharacterized membrane protein